MLERNLPHGFVELRGGLPGVVASVLSTGVRFGDRLVGGCAGIAAGVVDMFAVDGCGPVPTTQGAGGVIHKKKQGLRARCARTVINQWFQSNGF